MNKLSKRKKLWLKELSKDKIYSLDEAINLLKKLSKVKFSETVDIVFRLGVDAKKSDQVVRGSCLLPHGTGKKVKVLAFAKGEKEKEALDAKADFIGNKEIIEKIQKGWLDFDRVIATPDMMPMVSKVSKILGPRKLMPNPKLGTVSTDIGIAITNVKKGQIEFRVDKASNLHASVGKTNFSVEQIKENIFSIIKTVKSLKPPTAKGIYLQKLSISSSMGPGINVDLQSLIN